MNKSVWLVLVLILTLASAASANPFPAQNKQMVLRPDHAEVVLDEVKAVVGQNGDITVSVVGIAKAWERMKYRLDVDVAKGTYKTALLESSTPAPMTAMAPSGRSVVL